VFDESPFFVPNNSVSIMNGAKEGRLSCNGPGTNLYYIHYRSKVWGHLEMSLYFKEEHCFFNKDNIKLIKNTHYTLLMW